METVIVAEVALPQNISHSEPLDVQVVEKIKEHGKETASEIFFNLNLTGSEEYC